MHSNSKHFISKSVRSETLLIHPVGESFCPTANPIPLIPMKSPIAIADIDLLDYRFFQFDILG